MDGGAYTAERAAAISGVPKSTVHYWAREGVVVPSVSPERLKLWSYGDLLALRTVYWLRQRKQLETGAEVLPSKMPEVRRALRELGALDVGLFHQGRPTVVVTQQGQIHLDLPDGIRDVDGQRLIEDGGIDLIAPFTTAEKTRGVDLIEPGRHVRIVPGRLRGAPHLAHTRIDTEVLAALEQRGFDVAKIRRLYPQLSEDAVNDALAVEHQLRANLAA